MNKKEPPEKGSSDDSITYHNHIISHKGEKIMATMFELTATLRQLLELAGSDDPDEQQVFADTLEAVSGEIGVKADSYKYVMDQLEGQAQKCKEAAQYLSDKAARIAENEKRIKETIMRDAHYCYIKMPELTRIFSMKHSQKYVNQETARIKSTGWALKAARQMIRQIGEI